MELNLPKDAEGNVIPFDTEHLYLDNDSKQKVISFTFNKEEARWIVETEFSHCDPANFHLNKPDSLKQLAADLDRVVKYRDGDTPIACVYLNRCNSQCISCKFVHSHVNCIYLMLADIATRVHSLCGDAK